MKEKNSVHENYKNKIKLYKSYSRSYYINSKPLVSDKIFDDLKKEILKIEKDYGFDDKDSPSKLVDFLLLKILKNFLIE